MSMRRRSPERTLGAVVCASHCWATTCPSGPTASRATRNHARSTIFALRAMRPVRVQVKAWSAKASTSPPQPGGPQRLADKGSGRRRRRRRDKKHCLGRKCTGRLTRYGSQPAKHPCQPSAWRSSCASTALFRLGAHPPSVTSNRVQDSVKAGERLWGSGNASAHAAQYAAGAMRTAERKPRPPRAAGMVATFCANAMSASAMPPRQSSRSNVSHIAASCACAQDATACGGTVRSAWLAGVRHTSRGGATRTADQEATGAGATVPTRSFAAPPTLL